MNTNEISQKCAMKVTDFINQAVEPVELLKKAVSIYGKPIICSKNTMFNPKKTGCVWLTFELYLDYTNNVSGELMVGEVNNEGEIFTCTAHDYILSIGGTDADNRRGFAEKFAEHFFKTMGGSYAETKNEVLVGLYKHFIIDMESSIGHDVFDDYGVQCAIEDHRGWREDEEDS